MELGIPIAKGVQLIVGGNCEIDYNSNAINAIVKCENL
jgi:hypothetical protein